jgi:hypothetical protein
MSRPSLDRIERRAYETLGKGDVSVAAGYVHGKAKNAGVDFHTLSVDAYEGFLEKEIAAKKPAMEAK